ncbi:SDR family NAD(P)-dependent oxidoreductase [Kribbella sp. NPDC026596]|uniref:SDR family NAD(P)-dependent oxidoreductase n=1 Tax=Kribbella sp. NPDC026596 TaxID=3155122 RepID=UPI0033C97DE4
MSTDPRTRYPGPDQQDPEQQPHPGHGDAMSPEPDYGEDSYRGSGKLTGRRALITGGDSGIGRAVALAFVREGADVMISHLAAEEDDARETCRLVREAGRTAAAVPGDIQDEAHCNQLVERCVDELGGLDILVNNAAYQMPREGIADISTEQFDRVLKTNVYAMFWLCKAALPHLSAGAAIINATSIQAYDPSPNLLDYATSKAAILNVTKGLAQELASKGIRVKPSHQDPSGRP